MSLPAAMWHPVVCSHALLAGQNIVAGWVHDAELALWRSSDGAAQAWDNRCPHRSVRLSLGQVLGTRLACAYHGWQFEAGHGRCAAIPAHPGLAPPAQACVRTWPVTEVAGMVWVAVGELPQQPPPADALPAGWNPCRSLGVAAPVAVLRRALQAGGWQLRGPGWHHEALAARALLLDAQHRLSLAHVWTAARPGSAEMAALHAALRRLRHEAEALAATCAA